ncbi:MAG TPA: 16S rRNA (uracil(1498)-N(3))-methyltransferase, partial [Alphaproteobacteria bacterium]
QLASPDLWLVFAPVKRARIDFVAAKATELGVSALRPVLTRHTAVERVNVERLRANAIEAAEQCDRLDVPEVAAPVALDALIEDWPAGRRLMLCDESGAAPPVAAALAPFAAAPAAPWAVLTGPEGGFAGSELDALKKREFVTAVSLGPRTLRADTAALAALSCWQALVGDWRAPPSGSAGVSV